MHEVAIFGKKGSIAKFDLTENKSVWVGCIDPKFSPISICQYENFVMVFSHNKFNTKAMVHCFEEKSGALLWSSLSKELIKNGFPFYPHFDDGSLYYLASSKEVAKLNLQSGKLEFRKKFKKSLFTSYWMAILTDQVYLISAKDAKTLDKHSGELQDCPEIAEKINLKEISACLGNGISFLSSISLAHPQGDSGATMMAVGDAGGGGGAE